LQHVNDLIMSDARSGMFVTMFYGVLNRRTGQFTYASAGHNPPVWWRSAATPLGLRPPGRTAASCTDAVVSCGRGLGGTEAQMILLTAKGVVLGVAEDITLEERQVVIEPGDIVVLYTDGVTEPINDRVEEFGEERLMRTIAAASDKSCHELVRSIHAAVSEFVGDQPQFDDYTLVGIKRQM
jgi:sigma-B regulation protein RsbU (phosphoserine phosphatase)